MGRIGKVIKSYIAKLSGSGTNAQFSSVEEFAGDQRTVQAFGPCNEDFAPPENCKTLNIPLGRGRGFLVSAAYHNQKIAPVAVHGERRLYSTNRAGDTVMAEVFLKQDGTLSIKNAAGEVSISPAGLVEADCVNLTATVSAQAQIDCANLVGNVSVATNLTCPTVNIIGNLIVTGGISWSGVAQAPGGLPAAFSNGLVNTGGDIVSDGVSLEGHVHAQGLDSNSDTQVDTDAPT